ncbi:MAG TPA: histidine kinase [Candidatus Limnocylindrales bacterium]|nr:histidine kinase [Candidatus Limnocylindrales bacterium]
MSLPNPPQIEDRIARCRVILSVIALAAVFIDPTVPYVSSWMPIAKGRFTIDARVFIVMATHLVYSVFVYLAAVREWFPPSRLATWTVCADVVLGGAIALMTEGATSPFSAFFAFAVVVSGFRSGLRQAVLVTAVSVSVYVGIILISAPGRMNIYVMRPAYLAIVGYLVGYLGQHRIELQQALRIAEAAQQRHLIARDLHDGFAQALAGITLRIEGCRRLLRRNDSADALAELTELQTSVNREYDELRSYMSTLAGIPPSSPAAAAAAPGTRFSLNVRVDGSIDLIDHILQIAREGLSNVRRHAAAASARIDVSTDGGFVRISIDDDGVGLTTQSPPWSIASRVSEIGGQIALGGSDLPGSHMQILIPQA